MGRASNVGDEKVEIIDSEDQMDEQSKGAVLDHADATGEFPDVKVATGVKQIRMKGPRFACKCNRCNGKLVAADTRRRHKKSDLEHLTALFTASTQPDDERFEPLRYLDSFESKMQEHRKSFEKGAGKSMATGPSIASGQKPSQPLNHKLRGDEEAAALDPQLEFLRMIHEGSKCANPSSCDMCVKLGLGVKSKQPQRPLEPVNQTTTTAAAQAPTPWKVPQISTQPVLTTHTSDMTLSEMQRRALKVLGMSDLDSMYALFWQSLVALGCYDVSPNGVLRELVEWAIQCGKI